VVRRARIGPAGPIDNREDSMKPHSIRSPKFVWSLVASLACVAAAPLATAADEAAIKAFSSAAPGDPPAGWKFTNLPNKSATKFSVVDLNGARVLKVEADNSYGNLVHGLHLQPGEHSKVAWKWRVDKLIDSADLKVRSGEDSPAKLCVFFAFDAAKLPFGERAKLTLAKSATGEDVPTETLCYVWDNKLAVDTVQVSVFTKRIRFLVLQSGSSHLGQWMSERRDLSVDYQRMFGDESEGKYPEIVGVAVSADADNTHGNSLAYFGDVTLAP
jgi:hypothetical protein